MNLATRRPDKKQSSRPLSDRNFRTYKISGAVLLLSVVIVGIAMLEKNPWVHISGIRIDSMSYLKSQVVQNLVKPYSDMKFNYDKIGELKDYLLRSDYFTDVRLDLDLDLSLQLKLEEAAIIGTVMRDRLYYLNQKGRLIPVNWCKDSLILPEYEGLVFDAGRVISVQSFQEANTILDYIREMQPFVYKLIAKVYFFNDESPYFLLRNRKLLRISSLTMKSNLGRFAILFPELYHRDDYDLIDLRYDNQIITKK